MGDFFKKIKEKKVLVGGCFDILHYGHVKFLKSAKKEGDKLIVALESDEFIKKNKERKPFHNQKERAFILSCLDCVDWIIMLPKFKNSTDYDQLVQLIKPDVIAVSQGDPFYHKKKKQAKKYNAQVKIVTPLYRKFSSTKIVSQIKEK